jgi:hypothetical protein
MKANNHEEIMAEQDQPAVLFYDSTVGKVYQVVESEEVDVEGMRAIVAQADALVAANNPQPAPDPAPAVPEAPAAPAQPEQPAVDPNTVQQPDPNAAPAAPVAPIVQ